MMDNGFKILGEAMARRMHPDLDWPPPSNEVNDKLKRYQVMDQLELLWKMSIHPDLTVGTGIGGIITLCTVHAWIDNKYTIDTEATKQKLSRGMKALQSFGATIEKEYADQFFKIIGTFECGLKYTLLADREVACTKRVVGNEYVPPSSGYYREQVEWDCERIAFSAFDV